VKKRRKKPSQASPPRSGGKNKQSQASPPRSGGKNKQAQASPPRSGAENETGAAQQRRPRTQLGRRPRTVVLDVDSTLCGVEGVDWLATLRGPEIAQKSAELTDRAMAGQIDIGKVYGERLDIIRPTRDEVSTLSQVYRERLAPDAIDTIRAIRGAGIRIILVSGGFRQAIAPVARELGFADDDLFAVQLYWNERGEYVDYDRTAPTARQLGKLDTVRALSLARPILAVGDGATDLDMREAVDAFVAFTGFVRREAVVAKADHVVASFSDLRTLILG
jgi:phosphoserine phosphatase